MQAKAVHMTDAATRARELQRQALVIDGHSDILIPVTDGKMRLGDRVVVPDPLGWQPPFTAMHGMDSSGNGNAMR